MKKINKIGAFTALVFSIGAMNVMAGEAGSGPNPYVDCGIGGALFPDTHWAAISSNVIWDVGTTAVVSATASPETCNGKSVEIAEFINRTYDNLIEDTAKGEGEYVTAVFDIYGCNSKSQSAMISDLRGIVAAGISSPNYNEKTQLEKSELFYNNVNQVVEKQDADVCSTS